MNRTIYNLQKEEYRKIRRVVITGGPCGGKTTATNAAKVAVALNATFVPEGATMLLRGDPGVRFPRPGVEVPWTQTWQDHFENACLPLQFSLEETFGLVAENYGHDLLVCDRGILDCGAYLENGLEDLAGYGIDIEAAMSRYDVVLHLESLATFDAQKYEALASSNPSRFEPVGRAYEVEHRTREVWGGHPGWMFLGGDLGIDGKIKRVVDTLKNLSES